jgi:hypothetical protein
VNRLRAKRGFVPFRAKFVVALTKSLLRPQTCTGHYADFQRQPAQRSRINRIAKNAHPPERP